MARSSRRAFLASAGIALLAGCNTGGSPAPETAPPTTTDASTTEPTPTEPTPTEQTTVVETIDLGGTDTEPPQTTSGPDTEEYSRTIEEDGYIYIPIETDQRLQVAYEGLVREGPAVDFYFVTEGEFRAFRDGQRFRANTALSEGDTINASAEGTVEPGSYYLVVDNSNRGEARPPTNGVDDPARVELTVAAQQV